MSRKFYFAEIANTETQTFDNSLEHFHKAGISGTIRENIQNSIDAKLPGSMDPVEVSILMTEVQKSIIPGIDEIEEHIHSLEGGNSYTQETIDHMRESLNTDTVDVLIFEDSNTKGLSGANQIDAKTTYNTFAYKKGVHFTEQDEKIETIRGGSHGVGKIANNAASDLHLMFFSNHDEEGNLHIGGTTQLIEHQMEDSSYRSTGYFSDFNEKNQYVPYINEDFDPIFEKKSRGLKIVIPFLRKSHKNISGMIQSVCDNFFLAILEGKLIVTISDEENLVEINQITIQELIHNSEYYPQNLSNIQEIKKVFTPLYIENYLTNEPIKIEVSSNVKHFSFDLYFMYNESIKTGRVGIVRSMGMKIVDYKVPSYIRRPFNAVLIGGPKEDQYLKTLENEAHTDLSADALRDPASKKDAKKFLKNLNKVIIEKIDEEWERLNPSDGKIDTSDLLYEKEITFQSKLNEMSEKIELAQGKQIRKKKERRNGGTREGTGNGTLPKKQKTRRPRKLKPDSDNQEVSATLLLSNEVVNRMVLNNQEIIHFHLNNISDIPKDGLVNLSFRVVDGEGKEYENEFNLKEAYSGIIDGASNIQYEFDQFKISDVHIVASTIQLVLTKKNNRSDALKFIYKLEVLR
ncbi:hypothetical protein ACWOEJ_08390 [Enterococcus eurekensis]|uniref:Uncharacterized protein n=1 Tax=Enterococcus eurekensis TaxID=1159753 RepID=A0ABV9M7J2_9ENTE